MSRGARRGLIVVLSTVIACAVNLAIFGIGMLAGADYRFVNAGTSLQVDAVTLAGFSIVPLAIGLTLAATLSRRWRWVIPTALIVGPVLALGTIIVMTLPAGFTTPSFVALAMCHVALVPAMVFALRALRRIQ
jgi:hypothetical protein